MLAHNCETVHSSPDIWVSLMSSLFLESLLPILLLEAHLALVSALVLLHDGEELQCPLGAPGDVQQLEPPVRGEGGEPVSEDLVI